MAAVSRPSCLNPNADPFLYTMPFVVPPPPPKLQFIPPRVLWAPPPPLHGYGSSYLDVDPYYQHHHHHHPAIFTFYDVLPHLPNSDAFTFAGAVENSVLNNNNNNPNMKTSERKCKVKKWGSSQVRFRVRVGDEITTPTQIMESTTLMLKNIPNQFRRHHLLNILDEHCKWKNLSCNRNNNSFDSRRSEYDFVYLPMDFRKHWYDGKISNLGYAFVNFTTPTAASEFCEAFHRHQWEVLVNRKVCEIKRAKLQGLKALTEAFRNKIFWCHTNNYLPVLLEPPSDGCRRYRATPIGKRIARPPPTPIKKCG